MAEHLIQRDACPACEHGASTEILSRSFVDSPVIESIQRNFSITGMDIFELVKDGEYQLRECGNCGLIFQRNCFTEELMARIYELRALAPEVQARDMAKPLYRSAYFAEEIVTLVKIFNRKPSDIDVLDFGMGWGHWCYMAKAYGCNAFGLDLSRTKQEFATANGIAPVTMCELGKKTFDYINTEQVIEHVPHPLYTVRMLSGSLKPGGILKISVPNGARLNKERLLADWTNPARSRADLVSPLMHINTFSHNTVIAMANRAGLTHIRITMTYQYSNVHFLNINQGVKTILRPLYRRFARTTTYLHFKRPGAPKH